ncbi:MAG: BCCT family transporter, partial [Pikeienuella sp.]
MALKEPFTDLEIQTAPSGFYQDNSLPIALISKGIMVGLVLWALLFPANANGTLGSLNGKLLEIFNQFYIIVVGLFA